MSAKWPSGPILINILLGPPGAELWLVAWLVRGADLHFPLPLPLRDQAALLLLHGIRLIKVTYTREIPERSAKNTVFDLERLILESIIRISLHPKLL